MEADAEIPKIESKPVLRFAPWISATLMLVYTVIVQFFFITSLEEAFDFVEDLFKRMASSSWLIEIPLPLIIALLVYYHNQQSRERNINSLIFSLTALGIIIIGIGIYAILNQYPISASSQFNFILISIIIAISLLVSMLAIFIRKKVVKQK